MLQDGEYVQCERKKLSAQCVRTDSKQVRGKLFLFSFKVFSLDCNTVFTSF